MMLERFRLHLDKCRGCARCVVICPTGALTPGDHGPQVAHPDQCGGCGLCEDLCPKGAIECEFEIVG